MVLVNFSIERKMEVPGSSLIQLLTRNLNHVMKKKMYGTLNSELFPQVMKSVELIPVVSISVLSRKFMKSLELKMKKSISCFGVML